MHRHLRAAVACAALIFTCAAPNFAKTRKGDKFLNEGLVAEGHGDWDRAMELYQQAVDESPLDPAYQIPMRRARFQAGQMHVDRGEKLRSQGKLEEAMAEFQKALLADPGSAVSIQNLRVTKQMMDRETQQPSSSVEDRGLTPIERSRRETEARIATILSLPELKPTQPVPPLKMNNQSPRVLFETVGKVAGINVLFDSQFSGRNTPGFNVDMNASSIEQAFDYLAMLTRTYWKPITSNTIFVTEDNPTKRRDYEDNVMKVFYVTNTTTVQEFQEIAQAVRTVPEARRTFTYNAQKAIIVRGTADQVAMAEKLIHDLDKPKSEVVVDVVVMEANSSHTRDLAASILAAGKAGLSIPITFTPRNVILTGTTPPTTGTGGTTSTTTNTLSSAISLAKLSHVSSNDFSITLPGALLNALMTDSNARVRQSPQIRASDGQKATLNIGDRIPYATGSFQPGVGTVGVSPLVQTQFNFIDTGVNVEITPYVHSADEVTLHVDVNLSVIRDRIDLGGVSQPIIGQRKSVADIRLRDGEVTILGGLTSMQDSSASNGIPGLVNIPVLGKFFFGSQSTNKERGQLLIALIPHIVRTPNYTPENLREIGAGNDSTVKLSHGPRAAQQPAGSSPTPPPVPPPASAPASSPAGTPAITPAGVPGAPGGAPSNPSSSAAIPSMPPPGVPVPPGLAQPGPSTPAGTQPQSAPPLSGAARVTFLPGALQAQLSGVVAVNVQVENVSDLFAITSLKLKFDPAVLKLNDVTPGEMIQRDGGRVTSVKDINNETGEVLLTVTRIPGSTGVKGSGSIATLNFTAVGKGSSRVQVTELAMKNSQALPLAATLSELPVTVQ